MSILVTGGAGYIGSHMVRHLLDAGRKVVVIDSFVTGYRSAVPRGTPLLHADIADHRKVLPFLRQHRVTAVLHFAALSRVAESIQDPRSYFVCNVSKTLALLDTVLRAKVKHFVQSSTAAVYGTPSVPLIDEEQPKEPINPYGTSKLTVERVLAEYHRAYGLRFAALRYFNAAGAMPEHGLGERHEPETHLVPLVLQAALGKRPYITIHGDDYDTPDGTCVRDYIHVRDLAAAHLRALDYLFDGGAPGAFNLGTGRGCSVRELVAIVERVTGSPVPVRLGPRRAGDPARLVADPTLAARVLGFRAQHSSLEAIVRDAWLFHRGPLSKQLATPKPVSVTAAA